MMHMTLLHCFNISISFNANLQLCSSLGNTHPSHQMSWFKNTLETVAAKGKSMAGAVADGTLKKLGTLLGPGAAPAVRIDATIDLIKDFQAAVSGVGVEKCDVMALE